MLKITWEETQDLRNKQNNHLTTKKNPKSKHLPSELCGYVCPQGMPAVIAGLRQSVFVFEKTAQTGNILQHSGALQY